MSMVSYPSFSFTVSVGPNCRYFCALSIFILSLFTKLWFILLTPTSCFVLLAQVEMVITAEQSNFLERVWKIPLA